MNNGFYEQSIITEYDQKTPPKMSFMTKEQRTRAYEILSNLISLPTLPNNSLTRFLQHMAAHACSLGHAPPSASEIDKMTFWVFLELFFAPSPDYVIWLSAEAKRQFFRIGSFFLSEDLEEHWKHFVDQMNETVYFCIMDNITDESFPCEKIFPQLVL